MNHRARELARLYGDARGHDHWYVRGKLALDPVYAATADILRDRTRPLLDLGCGFGLLIASLRASGWDAPAHGLDYDRRKIATARDLCARHPLRFGPSRFDWHDLRDGLPDHAGDLSILDILQFFTPAQRRRLLEEAAARLSPHGVLIIRQTLEGAGGPRTLSRAVDSIARLSRWMAAAPTTYPTEAELVQTLSSAGLRGRFRPLPGRLPLANWFGVFTRPSAVSRPGSTD